jgi:ABC-type nitrate/sulfonate/bicarbonate transport system substrate-binding protein
MSDFTAANDPALKGEKNEIWITRCPVPTATGIALDQGAFEREFAAEGLSVKTLQETTNDPKLRAQHTYHHLTGLFREGGNIPPLWARASRVETTAVVGLTWVDERQALLARPGSGLSGAASLKGKRLGVSRSGGVSTDIWRGMALHGYSNALRTAGLTTDDVELVYLPAPAQDFSRGPRGRGEGWSQVSLDALLAGDVDVIYAKGAPAAYIQRQHGLDVVFDINAHPDPRVRINNGTPRPVTAHVDFVRERPDLVARYLAVLLHAAAWSVSHPADVRRIVAAETWTDEESVELAYGPDLHKSFDVRLSADWVAAFEIQKNFLRDWKLIPGDIDIARWIVDEPLQEARRLVASGQVKAPFSHAA